MRHRPKNLNNKDTFTYNYKKKNDYFTAKNLFGEVKKIAKLTFALSKYDTKLFISFLYLLEFCLFHR